MRRLPPLNALRAFESAARHLSFQKAAGELNVTASAVSHQIRQLEEHLGTPLFARSARAVSLTPAGRRLLPGLSAGFARLSDAVASLGPGTADDVLVVSTGPAFAAKWLAPRLYRFVDAHPGLEIRVAANLSVVDLAADGVDVALRHGMGAYPGLHVEQLFVETSQPLASPELVAGPRPLREPADLAGHTLLHDHSTVFLPSPPGWKEWLELAGVEGIDPERGMHFNHADHGLDAAASGAGVVLGRMRLASQDLRLGRLVAPFRLSLPLPGAVWFCCLPSERGRDKVALFRDWVFAEAAEETALIAEYSR